MEEPTDGHNGVGMSGGSHGTCDQLCAYGTIYRARVIVGPRPPLLVQLESGFSLFLKLETRRQEARR